MARRGSGRQPAPMTAETVAVLHDAMRRISSRPARNRGVRRNRKPDRAAIVNTLRGYFQAVGNHHRVHYRDSARYRMFARWAAAAVIDPELASACGETIAVDASKNLEAWHATLMIRIVMQAWRRCVDSDDEDSDEDAERIEMPLPWDSDAKSTAAVGAASPASLKDTYDMPPPPVRRRPYTDDETRKLIAEAVRYCLSHGYPATRGHDRMDIDCGCLLVAEALVSADVWKQISQGNRIAQAESVKRDWNAYRKWEQRRSGEYIRAAQIRDGNRPGGP